MMFNHIRNESDPSNYYYDTNKYWARLIGPDLNCSLDDQIRGSHSIRRDGKEREGDGGRESPPPPAANNAADPDDASLSTPKLTEAGYLLT